MDIKPCLAALLAAAGPALCASGEPLPSEVSWADRLSLGGDFRYRYLNQDFPVTGTRKTHLIRVRLDLAAHVDSEWSVLGRLSTGGEDPRAPLQPLGDGTARKPIRIDRAYLEYKPGQVAGLSLAGGKMAPPWISVGALVWDDDINPEGVSARYQFGFEPLEFVLQSGAFVVEQEGAGPQTSLYTAQAAAKWSTPDKHYVMAGAGAYLYDKLEGNGPLHSGQFWGNTTRNLGTEESPDLVYAGGFEEVEGFAEAGLELYFPVKVFGQYVVNPEAEDDNTAWLVGGGIGRLKAVRSMDLTYSYRQMERDAIVGAFMDSDVSATRGTFNGDVHRVQVRYQATTRLRLGTAVCLSKVDGASDTFTRYQFDVDVSF